MRAGLFRTLKPDDVAGFLCFIADIALPSFCVSPPFTRPARVILEGNPAISENLCWKIVIHPTAHKIGVQLGRCIVDRHSPFTHRTSLKKSIANMPACFKAATTWAASSKGDCVFSVTPEV